MSTTYHLVAARAATKNRPSGILGLGAALAAVVGIGALASVALQPASAPAVALPAMEASQGFWDAIDARPAISLTVAQEGYWEQIDSRPAIQQSEAAMGFWDVADARPAVSTADAGLGFWDHADMRPALSSAEPALAAAEQSRFAVVETAQGYETVVGPMGYGDLATIGTIGEYVDGVSVAAPAKSYADLATVPGPTGFEESIGGPSFVLREGAQGYETVVAPSEEDLGPPAYVVSEWQFDT